jgi:DNA repair protein SbcD/Mre11
MILLHTSDWHLGRRLYDRQRHEEYAKFLEWLIETIRTNQVDALLVAGDVFDSTAPGVQTQDLYYNFLADLRATACRHVVIIGGNHDSPAFLNAPRHLLSRLSIHVVGGKMDTPDGEIIVLKGNDGNPEGIVVATPFLRETEMRLSRAGESPADKERSLIEGVTAHYREVCALAEQTRSGRDIPLVVMGHLFAAGGQIAEHSGDRKPHVGSLIKIPATAFPPDIDYLALGHLHLPQTVQDNPTRRYSGSPLTLGFGDTHRQRSVCLVTSQGRKVEVGTIPVPIYQRLERVRGSLIELTAELERLVASGESVYVEAIHTGTEVIGGLRDKLEAVVKDSRIELLRTEDVGVSAAAIRREHPGECLDDLAPEEVFLRCLREQGRDGDEELLDTFREAMRTLPEEAPCES